MGNGSTAYRVSPGHRAVSFVCLLVAVTGLATSVFAGTSHHLLEVPVYGRVLAGKSNNTVMNQAIRGAGAMLIPFLVGVIDAEGTRELEGGVRGNHSVGVDGHSCSTVATFNHFFLASIKGEQCHFGRRWNLATVLRHRLEQVERFIRAPRIGNGFYLRAEHEYLDGISISNIFKPNVGWSEIPLDIVRPINVAGKVSNQSWFSEKFDARSMFLAKVLSGLQDAPNSHEQVADTAHSDYTQEEQFKLSGSADLVPITTKGVFFLLLGFLGGCYGFTALFARLLCGTGWKRISDSVAMIVRSVVIFHIGLFCLK